MHSVEELFRLLGGKTVEDNKVFRDWLSTMGSGTPESVQLTWILENPRISSHTKQMLIKSIVRETAIVDKEKEHLLRVGRPTNEHESSIMETKKWSEELHSKIRLSCFGMAAAFMLVFFIILANYKAEPSNFGTFMTLSMLFFGLAVVSLTEAWRSSTIMKESQENATKTEEAYVGRRLQMRITAIEQEEERLHELNKVIVKNGAENADCTESTSVA